MQISEHLPFRPALVASKRDNVHFESSMDDSNVSALAGDVSRDAGAVSAPRHISHSGPDPASHNLARMSEATPVAVEQRAAPTYNELVSEADELLQKLRGVQTVRPAEQDDPAALLTAQKQQAAARNRLAIVRVRVSCSLLHPLSSVCVCLAKPLSTLSCSSDHWLCLHQQ